MARDSAEAVITLKGEDHLTSEVKKAIEALKQLDAEAKKSAQKQVTAAKKQAEAQTKLQEQALRKQTQAVQKAVARGRRIENQEERWRKQSLNKRYRDRYTRDGSLNNDSRVTARAYRNARNNYTHAQAQAMYDDLFNSRQRSGMAKAAQTKELKSVGRPAKNGRATYQKRSQSRMATTADGSPLAPHSVGVYQRLRRQQIAAKGGYATAAMKRFTTEERLKKLKIEQKNLDSPSRWVSFGGSFFAGMAKFNTTMAATSFITDRFMAAVHLFEMATNAYASAIQKGFEIRDEYGTDINRAMAMTNGDYTKAYAITDKAYTHAIATRTDSADYMNSFSRFNMAYKGWKNEDEAFAFTDAIAQAMKIGGASATETGSVMLQLSQAFNKGNLNGDELRAISENSFILRDAIQKQVIDKLQTMAEAGEITTAEYEKAKTMGITDLGASGYIKAEDIVKATLGIAPQLNELYQKSAFTTSDFLTNAKTMLKQQWGASGANEAFTGVMEAIKNGMPSVSNFLGSLFGTLSESAIPKMQERFENFFALLEERGPLWAQTIDGIINLCGDFADVVVAVLDRLGGYGFSTAHRWNEYHELNTKNNYANGNYKDYNPQRAYRDESYFNSTVTPVTAPASSGIDYSTVNPAAIQHIQEVNNKATETKANVKSVETTAQEVASTSESVLSGIDSYSWGAHMGQNFAAGIRGAIGLVKSAVLKLAEAGAALLQHTTPKEGPLKHDDVWGKHLVENFANGIKDNADIVEKASRYLANKTDNSMRDSLAANMRTSLTNSWYRNLNNQSFTTNVKFGDVRETADVNQIMSFLEDMVANSMNSAVVS